MGWSTERPGQDVYRQAHQNIGKYGGLTGKPYINPDVPMYVPNDGENCIRIVDPIELIELQIYFFDVNFHREVGFRKDYFLCLARHNIGPCAVCENATEDLWNTDKEAAKGFLPDMRRLMWVLDLKKPEEANILKLWSAPRKLSDEILAQSRDPEMDVIQEVSHPYEGVPIYFTRTGKGLRTVYSGVKLARNPMPIDESIADQRFRFMDILIVPTYEEVHASFHMLDMPAESDPELPPTSAYNDDGYDSSPSSPPAHEQMGARDAAEAAMAQETADAGGDVPSFPDDDPSLDYSGRVDIDPAYHECFRRQTDQWDECADCGIREQCLQPWPPKRVAKPKAKPMAKKPAPKQPPQRTPAASAPPRTPSQSPPPRTPAQSPPPRTAPTGATDNAARIRSAQEKLKADIARRKSGG